MPPRSAVIFLFRLQAVRRDAEFLDPPRCAARAQNLLVRYMDARIQGYLDFAAQDPDATVQDQLNTAHQIFAEWPTAWSELP